jgi:hypothetical protein
MHLKLDWCSYEAAKYAVMRWHSSKTMPAGKIVRVGVWENGSFIGCVLFARGACSHLGKKFGLQQTEVCELVRVALNKHKTPVTRIVAIALKMLKKSSPGMRLVVSFADTNQGHAGKIYQAGNWIYDGLTNASKGYIDRNGKLWHNRKVRSSGYTKQFGQLRKCVKSSECEVVELKGKHRYLMPLDKRMKKQIAALAQPYPCAQSIGGDALDVPVKRGQFKSDLCALNYNA